MPQTSKTILTIIITAAVVGAGVYFWQQPKPAGQIQEKTIVLNKKEIPVPMPTPAPTPSLPTTPTKEVEKLAGVYKYNKYKLEFTVANNCYDFLYVTEERHDEYSKALIQYPVFVRGSKTWPADQAWFTYAVYSPKEYNKMDPNPVDPTTIAQPAKILTLSSGLLVTRRDPQDLPNDLPEGCGLNSITIKEK